MKVTRNILGGKKEILWLDQVENALKQCLTFSLNKYDPNLHRDVQNQYDDVNTGNCGSDEGLTEIHCTFSTDRASLV